MLNFVVMNYENLLLFSTFDKNCSSAIVTALEGVISITEPDFYIICSLWSAYICHTLSISVEQYNNIASVIMVDIIQISIAYIIIHYQIQSMYCM